MEYISNLNNTPDKVSFDLDNKSKNVKISMANAIRRAILSDIETYIMDPHKTTFFENDSILNNEFLSHRLSLIPIVLNIPNINYDNLVFACNKKNEDENIMSVYASDFTCTDAETKEIIDNNLIFKYPGILFAKLKVNQYFSFESRLSMNTAFHGGSAYMAVSKCVYTFKIDDAKVKEEIKTMNESDKISFFTQDVERVYERNGAGEPSVYQYVVESIGFYDALTICTLSVKGLITRLEEIKTEFMNTKSSKIILTQDKESTDFFDFLIEGENDTIGNLITSYISSDDNVFYCGYVIKHPLNININLKIKLKKDNDVENVIATINRNIDIVIGILADIGDGLK